MQVARNETLLPVNFSNLLELVTYLATETIFEANDLLRQNPAPPVANQNDILD